MIDVSLQGIHCNILPEQLVIRGLQCSLPGASSEWDVVSSMGSISQNLQMYSQVVEDDMCIKDARKISQS
jgi:methyl coenzyme M reductase beta subunit